MEIASTSLTNGESIDPSLALGVADPLDHARFSTNRNPHIAWSGLPAGTQSVAIVYCDKDAPTVADDVNQEGRTVPHDLPRAAFYHWIVADLDPSRGEVREGEFSSELTPGGKPGPDHPSGARQGRNSYTEWFANDPDMTGDYFGYDGPFPPWNDERTHNYYLTVYALDIDVAPIDGVFDGPTFEAAIAPHVLESAQIHGTYRISE